MKEFQFIKLLDFTDSQRDIVIKALSDSIENSNPIILDKIDVFIEAYENIQIITLSPIKEP